jgi:RimJ/RimL family protein N-acetyltransferase/catechol 2,3-dioxygenase-like lactoylglutathione lyase family enzyme
MAFTDIRPMLKTHSINETIEFYTGSLGFTLIHQIEDEGFLAWCLLEKDNISFMFSAIHDEEKKDVGEPRMTGVLYLYLDNVDEYFEQVKDKCQVEYSPCDQPYDMRDFCIRDNNGYVIMIGQLVRNTPEYDKFFPPTFTLETQKMLLRLMQPGDYEPLLALAQDRSIWQYFTKDLGEAKEMKLWMAELLQERAMRKRFPFTIIDKGTNTVCGSTSYLNISMYDKRLEIGSTWLGTPYIGTGINRHAKFALLSYAFEVMKMERVEIKTDNLNERSKAALLKVGMIPEGVHRSHMLMPEGRRRDSLYFSIIRSEWEERKYQFFMDML